MNKRRDLIFGDVHQNTDWIEDFLQKYEKNVGYRLAIFLGDYLDSHIKERDELHNVFRTAVWLRESIQKRNRVHLIGNHDLAYLYYSNPAVFCPGFTVWKSRVFNEHFPQNLRNHFKLYYKIDNFLFTHAGIKNDKFLVHPDGSFNHEWLDYNCKEGLRRATYTKSPFLSDMESLLWLRWWHLPIIEGINQICGHTFSEEPQIKIQPELINKKERFFNVCLDTNSKYYGILEEGKFGYSPIGSIYDKDIVWIN